uniref:Reverse transcriptase domain-containing protein n=1 Tax=Tanacetum cinerariifolium TaxID=118510 RepID=A0A699H3E9_TANCI|nr:hypothetical protein [Tanacetum cinerariifolium]
MYAFPNVPVYTNLNLTCAVLNPLGSVTPFVCWIEDYPLPDGLKMPSHISSYDGKGDPNNFLQLFKGAIRMQKWLMPVACHMFTYTLKDSARIWLNSQKAGRIVMRRMGIVVLTIHRASKFHTKKGIRTVLSVGKTGEGTKRARKIFTTNEERIPSCVNAEEKIIVNDKHKQGLSQRLLSTTRDRLENRIPPKGIKANPSKVKAVIDLDQPRTLKYIQSLNGKLAALSQFLSKGAERSLAFFKSLKGCKDKKSIQWTTEADKALEKIKKLVQTLPTLTALRVPTKSRTQLSYLGEACNGLGLRSKKTLKMLLGPHDNGEHDIMFLRRNEKETPADFLVEITLEDNDKKQKPKEVSDLSSKWRLYTDGASNSDGSGVVLMLIDHEGKECSYALRFEFKTTNNEAEYEALLAGYYWPSMHWEVAKAIQYYEKCKAQSAIRKDGTSEAIAAGSTWTFSHWGIHILRPLPMAPKGLQFLAIAVEHSIKWVEAKPVTTINGRQVEKFVWEYVAKAWIKVKTIKGYTPPLGINLHQHGDLHLSKDGKGFTRSTGGDSGFKDGLEEKVAFWEEGTCT